MENISPPYWSIFIASNIICKIILSNNHEIIFFKIKEDPD